MKPIGDKLGRQEKAKRGNLWGWIKTKRNRSIFAPAVVAQWIKCLPMNRKFSGSIPSQDTYLGYRLGSGLGTCNQSMYLSNIDVSLPLFLPPSPSL